MFKPVILALALLVSSTAALAVPALSERGGGAGGGHGHGPGHGPGGHGPGHSTPLAQVHYQCTVPGTAAITFDDGPWVNVPAILQKAVNHNIKVTFFLNGNNWGCIYDPTLASYVQAAYNAGHQIASHTWAHTDMTTQNETRLAVHLDLLDDALKKIIGVVPTMVRPPYGATNDLAREVAGKNKQDLIMWDYDAGDAWHPDGETSFEQVAQRYTDYIATNPTSLLSLNHDTLPMAPEIIDVIVPLLKAQGLRIVTVAECLGKKPYQHRRRPHFQAHPDSTWTCDGTPPPGGV